MNKYEKAFNHLKEHTSFDTVDEMIDIKELVEKAIPAKPTMKKYKAKSMNFMVMSFGFAPNVKNL